MAKRTGIKGRNHKGRRRLPGYGSRKAMKKSFIIDSNVILSAGAGGGSRVLDGFLGGRDANDIYIPGTVMQELDRHKNDPGESGYNGRDFIRAMDELREKGDLVKGVSLKRGKVFVEPDGINPDYLPVGFNLTVPDNRIISTCIHLAKQHPRKHFVFVTNDVSCRVNADICFRAAGVSVGIESYKNDMVGMEGEEEYLGYVDWTERDLPAGLVDELYAHGKVPAPHADELFDEEFVILPGALAIHEGGNLKPIRDMSVFGLKSLYNAQQKMAMYALLAPPEQIPLVVLTGAAGSGKTFLPVAAGIDRIYGQRDPVYDRMIISRSNALNRDEELGHLPGDIDEKMEPLIMPIKDSIESILRVKNNGNAERAQEIAMQIEDIFETCIDIMPMLYVRGRSLTRKFVLLDEAQNISAQQAYDLMTRCSTGSKIVMVGDTGQIDNPLLTPESSGLSVVWRKMRGKGVAMVRFGEHEVIRSDLVRYAMERMKH